MAAFDESDKSDLLRFSPIGGAEVEKWALLGRQLEDRLARQTSELSRRMDDLEKRLSQMEVRLPQTSEDLVRRMKNFEISLSGLTNSRGSQRTSREAASVSAGSRFKRHHRFLDSVLGNLDTNCAVAGLDIRVRRQEAELTRDVESMKSLARRFEDGTQDLQAGGAVLSGDEHSAARDSAILTAGRATGSAGDNHAGYRRQLSSGSAVDATACNGCNGDRGASSGRSAKSMAEAVSRVQGHLENMKNELLHDAGDGEVGPRKVPPEVFGTLADTLARLEEAVQMAVAPERTPLSPSRPSTPSSLQTPRYPMLRSSSSAPSLLLRGPTFVHSSR